jgi:hypothetical protein
LSLRSQVARRAISLPATNRRRTTTSADALRASCQTAAKKALHIDCEIVRGRTWREQAPRYFGGDDKGNVQLVGRAACFWARQWWEYLRRADERGTLLIGFTAFVVVGAKRGSSTMTGRPIR